jgi:hypothetical protein
VGVIVLAAASGSMAISGSILLLPRCLSIPTQAAINFALPTED